MIRSKSVSKRLAIQTQNKYNNNHIHCPICKSDIIEQTCGRIILHNIGEAEDKDRATCGKCEWEGIVHDLIGDETKE